MRGKSKLSAAAFGRLCVETAIRAVCRRLRLQPPSGGCVLKQSGFCLRCGLLSSAAFGRLCVETVDGIGGQAVSGQPPSGGCVLKPASTRRIVPPDRSRLQAAVC